MDKYSRLLVHFSTVNGNKKDEDLFPSFVKDVSVLESPNEELEKIIKDDLPTLLPAILILSVHEDVSIRTAIARTFDTFCLILNKNPSVKNESWWKDMEAKLIAQQFSCRLVKMVELNDEPWADDWAFVTNLIVHDEHVHGTAINSLLKVVETAFKMSKKNDAIMEKAYFCWNQLIDVFSKHPRVVCSQKLVELLVRPLSTTHLSLKCPDLKMQTWCHLMKKIGFSCGNKCKFVMEPFIEFMYLKGEDSLCINYSKNCMEAYAEMIEQKKIYKYYALKIMSAFSACYNSCNQEMEQLLVKIWTGILDNIADVDKNNRNAYLLEIFTRFHEVSQTEKQELNNKLMKILVEKEMFNIDNLRSCIISELSITSVFSDFMKFEDFRNISFPATVKDLKENFSDGNKKPQNNIDLQIWDLLCDIYSAWMKNQNGCQEPSSSVDSETSISLLMIPFTYKQWSVAVQKTWYSVLDSVLSSPTANGYLPQLLERIQECIKESQISAALCVEICMHITNKDKAAFKMIMPALNVASAYLPPKDSKPLLDMLVLLENAVARVPKSDLTKFVNDLMIYGNKYEHPYGLRIKTKISKVQRKLFALKENNDTNKEQEISQQLKNQDNSEQANGCKNRSPIMAQSNFLQRLAKAEEKKKKKCPSMASIFGDSGGGNHGGEGRSQETADPGNAARVRGKEDVCDKEEIGRVEERRQDPVMNGRCSPALPEVVTILTPNKAKRSQAKSPEPNPVENEVSKKPASVKMPPPPTYFEDDAQDFVIVPPKPKTTPLTEHQKEILSKRRTDIPALYQDLSQDTLTDSQSLKEIITLKTSDKECKSKACVEVQGSEVSEIVDLTNDSDLPGCTGLLKNASADKGSEEREEKPAELQGSAASMSIVGGSKDSIKTEKALNPGNEPGISEEQDLGGGIQEKVRTNDTEGAEVLKTFAESEVRNDITKEATNSDSMSQQNDCGNKCESSERLESPQEIIENTPQLEPVVSLNLTPTKQSGPPTPRNLIRKITLLEQEDSVENKKPKFIEDREEEREKENIIINAKESLEKNLPCLVKRRSMRKSSCKFSTKKIDDLKEGKVKTKKEPTDPLKLVTDEDLKEKNAICTTELVEGQINTKAEGANPSQVAKSLNPSEEPSEILLNDKIQDVKTNSDEEKDVLKNSELTDDTNTCSQIDVLNEIKLHDNQLPIQTKNFTEDNVRIKLSGEGECAKVVKEDLSEKECPDALIIEKSSDKELTATDRSENQKDHSSQEDNCSLGLTLSDGVDEGALEQSDAEGSPGGDVSNWAMATPEKRGKKKKKIEKNLSPRFSPKQLRSKRLSLTKTLEPPDEPKKSMRKSSPLSNERKIDDKNNVEKDDHSKNSDSKLTDVPVDQVPTSDDTLVLENSLSDTVVSESNIQKRGRKRKSQDESAQEVEGKKKKNDVSTDEISQESLLVVKNNIVKPRKKKIIKSNVKHSPNNLEQWLIKSGKTVVKTSLISQDKALNEAESKIIDESSDIQMNVDEPKTLVVEIPASSSPQNPDIVVIKASPKLDDSGDMHNCTLIDDSSFNLNISSSEDENVTKSNENPSELPLEALQCNETELPPSTSQESDESIGRRAFRRKRRLLKREETPFRDSAPSPEDEQFDAKRERLTTPFRPRRRSAQMVKMATGEEEQEQNITPVRRRSISAVRLTENWPEGRLEEWVPCMPTPPTHSPSLGILRRKPVLSPLSSPTSSPSIKKKRVSFLDPPVSKGLLYYKGPETLGQIQHADIPPGEKPLWRDEETDLVKAGPSGMSIKKESIDGGFEAAEGEDELTAIQEFLNSTPDAPWSKTIPPELDVKQIPGLTSSLEPLNELLQRLTSNEEERGILFEEMKKLNVSKVSDISTITIIDLNRLCNQFPKIKSLVKIIEEYLEERTKLTEPPPCVEVNSDMIEDIGKPMEIGDDPKAIRESEPNLMNDKESELRPTKSEDLNQIKGEEEDIEVLQDEEDELKCSKGGEKELSTVEVEESEQECMEDEGNEIKIEEVKSVEFTCKSVQTEPVRLDDSPSTERPLNRNAKVDIDEMLKDSEFRLGLAEHIPRLLSEREFLDRLDEGLDKLLQEKSPFLERLAAHADYAFIARLCAAIVVLRENPG